MNYLKAGWIGILGQEDDFWVCAKKLSEFGYQGCESTEQLLIGDVTENVKRFQSLGLQTITVTADLEEMHKGNLKKIIQTAGQLKASRATVWVCNVNMSFWQKESEYDKVMKDIEVMEKAAKALQAEGITLCYHNHYQDFTVCYKGLTCFDIMIANSENLKFELDIAWVANGMQDPVSLIHQIAPRLSLLHVKDYIKGERRTEEIGFQPIFTSVGNGELPIKECLEAASQAGIEWAVVEQDKLHQLSPMDSLRASYLNMKESGYVI